MMALHPYDDLMICNVVQSGLRSLISVVFHSESCSQ